MIDWIPTSLYPLALSFLLTLTRVSVLVQLVPFLGGKATPQSIKVTLALTVTIFLSPDIPLESVEGGRLALLILKEGLVGLTLGFVTALLFDALRISGQIIDTTRGQNLATALVPQLPNRVSLTANVTYQLAVAIFLVAGGHLFFMRVIAESYIVIPLYELPSSFEPVKAALTISRLFGDTMLFATGLALPAITALLCSDIVLAFVNRAAPQVQVFFLGMPLKSLLGVFIVALTLGSGILDHWLPQTWIALESFVALVGGAP